MNVNLKTSGRWLIALGAVFVPAIVSGALELPFTFKAGNPIKASEVNANFEALAARIDGLSAAPQSKVVGSLTVDTVLDAAPIVGFSQSISRDFIIGQTSKPRFSEVTIEREVGPGTPTFNRDMCLGKSYETVQIELGQLGVELGQVLIVGVSTSGSGAAAREQLKLTYGTITWRWTTPGQPVVEAEWDVAKGTGTGGKPRDYVFGYFPKGIEIDAAYEPISSYSHAIGCPSIHTACKPAHGPVVVTRPIGAATLDALGLAASGAAGSSVEISSFSDETTVKSVLELGDAIVTTASISTAADGTLQEQSSFGYVEVTWTADAVTATYNVALNK